MKVTFLTGEYPPMQGGIADHIAYLARHMDGLGVESSVLIHRRWQDVRERAGAGGAQEAGGGDGSNDNSLNPAWRPVAPRVSASIPAWDWRCWPAVTGFLKNNRPDVLHLQYQAAAFDLAGWPNWLPWYLHKRRAGARLVTTFHDLRVPYIFPKAGPLRWRSILALARYSDAVICTNREDLQILDRSLRNQAPPLRLIPLGSNVEPQPPAGYDRVAWRRLYRADERTLLLAYFGFLNESKGGEELIEALARLRQQGIPARLLLIGGDVGHADPTNVTYARQVRHLIERYDLAEFVHFTGYTGLAEVSANLLAADAMVMPYRDGVSFRRTTLIAALRHGCPVVSTVPADPALVPEIRPGENMLLAPPRSAAALADAIAGLARNPALRQRLAQGARQLGSLFDWNGIAGRTVDLYRAVLQTPVSG